MADEILEKEEKQHISFSEIYLYDQCKYRHHIEYNLKNRSEETIHTVFGNAVHDAIDKICRGQSKSVAWIGMGKRIVKFIKKNPFHSYYNKGEQVKIPLEPRDWFSQACVIYNAVFDWLEENFPSYELFCSELELYEPIQDIPFYKFKGFIDLVIKVDKEYHLIDFKTSNWGWDQRKRSETKKQYQISLYKKFFCEKNKIDPKLVKTHFVLLKRNPPKKSNTPCELITVSSGPKKLQNATEWLTKQGKGIHKGIRLKNRTACTYCPWFHTKLCP